MSKFVRYYKKCKWYIQGEEWWRIGCSYADKEYGMGVIFPCLEECGFRCKWYEVKK